MSSIKYNHVVFINNIPNAAPRAAFKQFDNSMVKVIPKQIIKWLKIGHSGL